MLHIVKHSPFISPSLSQCLSRLAERDGVLLIGDGAYALQQLDSVLAALGAENKLYVLREDAKARGIKISHNDVHELDYPGFVQLTVEYPKSLSW